MTKLSIFLPSIFTTLIITFIFIIILNSLHPIHLVILLMIYTLLICFYISLWRLNYIYSILLFLIIIRGLLIIFLYFSRLISNEQNKISWNKISFIFINLILNFIIFFIIYINNSQFKKYPILNNVSSSTTPLKNLHSEPPFINITKIFIYPNNYITLISIFYLLIALFTIIKICSLKSSSLRKIN